MCCDRWGTEELAVSRGAIENIVDSVGELGAGEPRLMGSCAADLCSSTCLGAGRSGSYPRL